MKDEQTHPAWGMIQICHQEASGKGTALFRTPTYSRAQVCIRISHASLGRTSGPGHVGDLSPWPGKQIVEVYLSPVQYAELISRPNSGNGVPCTLGYLGGERLPPPPYDGDDLHEAAESAAERGVAESVRVLDALIAKVLEKVDAKKGLSLTDLRELLGDLNVARMRSTSDLDYWRREMATRASAMRSKVVTDLHATADLIVRQMGLGALAEKARAMFPTFEAPAIDVDSGPEGEP